MKIFALIDTGITKVVCCYLAFINTHKAVPGFININA